jgi:TolB-like protein
MAVEGGVFVSKEVHDQLANQKEFEGVSLGLQSMKGVGRLIEVYGLKGDMLIEPKPSDYQDNKINVHTDDEVPSIAIIPFENKGKDEDAFYAYGISADLISDCSGAGLIRVAGLKDIEGLDYKKLQYDELASKLYVRYVSHGSLWKMDDMFQLSIELYDTKDSKVIWSDRWQEDWNNLPAIKGKLSDGLLKTLNTKNKVKKKVETTNIEAYEYYLKGKHKFEKRDNMEDTEIARGLLSQAIKMDNNLLIAKHLLGWSYFLSNDKDKAMRIFTDNLQQAEDIGDKCGIGYSIGCFGAYYLQKGNYERALEYYTRALAIHEKLDEKYWIGISLTMIGIICYEVGEGKKACNYLTQAYNLFDKIGHKRGITYALNGLGACNRYQGNYEKALEYCTQTLEIAKEIGDKYGIIYPLSSIGIINWNKGEFETASQCIEKAIVIQKKFEVEKNSNWWVWITTHQFLTYKHFDKEYDENVIHMLIKEATFIPDVVNYRLYQLLEETPYLQTAYNQVQEKADNLEPDVAAKFLSYPIPKAIVEEWEKVK